MKKSEINEIINSVIKEEGDHLVEEIKEMGSKISLEDFSAMIAANIPIVAAHSAFKVIDRLGLIQIDPEDED